MAGKQSEITKVSPSSKVFTELVVVNGIFVHWDRVVIQVYFIPKVTAEVHEGTCVLKKPSKIYEANVGFLSWQKL